MDSWGGKWAFGALVRKLRAGLRKFRAGQSSHARLVYRLMYRLIDVGANDPTWVSEHFQIIALWYLSHSVTLSELYILGLERSDLDLVMAQMATAHFLRGIDQYFA